MKSDEHHLPRKGEVRIKEWVHSESERTGLTVAAIYGRMSRGKYKDRLTIRKINYQVGFVKDKQQHEHSNNSRNRNQHTNTNTSGV